MITMRHFKKPAVKLATDFARHAIFAAIYSTPQEQQKSTSMTTNHLNSHETPPSFSRMLAVAAGPPEKWTPEEQRRKQNDPAWCLQEAMAHLAIGFNCPDRASAKLEYRAAIQQLDYLPNQEAKDYAFQYLLTFVEGDELELLKAVWKEHRAEVVQPKYSSLRRGLEKVSSHPWLTGGVVVAVTMMIWIAWPNIQIRPPHGGVSGPPVVGLTTFSPRLTLASSSPPRFHKGSENVFHAGEIIEYRNKINSDRDTCWLLQINDEGVWLVQTQPFEDNRALVTDELELDARDCFEFYVTLVSDEPLFPHVQAGESVHGLSPLCQRLQSLSEQHNASNEQVESEIRQALANMGISSSELDLHVDRFVHRR